MAGKTKRIVIDARMVGPALHGIARYVTLMARGLREFAGGPYELLFWVAPGMEQSSHFQGFRTQVISTPFLHPSEQWALPAALKSARADLYHSPSFASLLVCPCPWIVTVHDLNHLTFGGMAEKVYYQTLLKRFARGAQALLTVSEFSKSEIVSWTGREGVEVVYNAIDPGLAQAPGESESQEVLRKYGLERGKYFFSLSNAKPHKNIRMLVDSHGAYRAQGGRLPLVLSLTEFGASPGVRALGSLSEADVQVLLANAGALFFPSIYEGFGLPPVEAVLAGVRVALSDIPAHREALQDLAPSEALWVLPRDPHGWTQAFHRAEKEDFSRPVSGPRILERYSVRRLGESMDRVYRRVLEGTGVIL